MATDKRNQKQASDLGHVSELNKAIFEKIMVQRTH